jgi:hypothetical protein
MMREKERKEITKIKTYTIEVAVIDVCSLFGRFSLSVH